jgi:hypothetical protein
LTIPFAAVCDAGNKGKRVAVDGYLRFPDSFSGDLSVVLRLYQNADGSGTPIGVQTRFGELTNQVEMVSDQYTDENLKVHITNGQDVGFDTRVRVSGTMYVPGSSATVEFACGLENPLIEKAP